jgi:hypothetical protein
MARSGEKGGDKAKSKDNIKEKGIKETINIKGICLNID